MPKYFYTKDTPHQWSSGPDVISLNLETHQPISSLEEARELAQRSAKSEWGYENFVRTTYGVMYDADEEPNT